MKTMKIGLGLIWIIVLACLPKEALAQWGYGYSPYSYFQPYYGYNDIYRQFRYQEQLRYQYSFYSNARWKRRGEIVRQGFSEQSLMYQLEHISPEKRKKAAELLKRYLFVKNQGYISENEEIREALEESALNDPITGVRYNAIKTLLGCEKSRRLQIAIEGLGKYPLDGSDPWKTIRLLARTLSLARDYKVREEAARSLGNYNSEKKWVLGILSRAKQKEPLEEVRKEIDVSIKKIKKG